MTVDARESLENRFGILSLKDEFPGGTESEPAWIQWTCHLGSI